MKLADYVHDELNKPFVRLLNFAKIYESIAADINIETMAEDDAEVKPLGRSAPKEGMYNEFSCEANGAFVVKFLRLQLCCKVVALLWLLELTATENTGDIP